MLNNKFAKLTPSQMREVVLSKARQMTQNNAVSSQGGEDNKNNEQLISSLINEISELKSLIKEKEEGAEKSEKKGRREEYGMTRFKHRQGTLGAMYDQYVIERAGQNIFATTMYRELKSAHAELSFTLTHVQNHLRQLFSRQESLNYKFYKTAPHTYLYSEYDSEEQST